MSILIEAMRLIYGFRIIVSPVLVALRYYTAEGVQLPGDQDCRNDDTNEFSSALGYFTILFILTIMNSY